MYNKASLLGYVLMGVLLLSVSASAYAACTAGTDIGGIVFQELPFNGSTANTYGTKDSNEAGVSGVTVTLQDASGATYTRTTDVNGAWDSNSLSLTYPVRMEFSWSQSWLQVSPVGAGSNSSVQFVQSSDCNLNQGLYVPSDYHTGSLPDYVIPTYINGDGTGDGAGNASLYKVPYAATGFNGNGGTTATQVAVVSELGSVWGQAYDKESKHIYISSLLKRHVGFAHNPGSIYVMDNSSGTPGYAGTFTLQGVNPSNGGASIDLGSVCRTSTCASSGTGIASDYVLPTDKGIPNIDLDTFAKVGKVSYGDIDMQPGSHYLWAVNLFQKALIRMDVSGNPVSSPPADVEQYILTNVTGYPTSGTGQLRPWGLGFYNGKGYLGVVSDASTSGNKADLLAYVLSFDPDNIAAGFTTVVSFDPNLQRSVFLGDFLPWKDTWTYRYWTDYSDSDVTLTFSGAIAHYAQPILSDIDFDEKGYMFLSFADRFGHQMGAQNLWPQSGATAPDNLTSVEAKGDTKVACKTSSGYEIEGTGSCYVGAEFIQDMSGNGTQENAEGASALLKGTQQILSVSIDPNPATSGSQYMDSQGVMTYGLNDGAYDNWYTLYVNTAVDQFDKANGLGDIEFLTAPAPIEIGNRMWLDANQNGIQDAGEAGIPGETVQLLSGATVIATAVTTADGTYYFSNATGTDTASRKYGISQLQPNTAYTVRFPTTVTVSGTTYNLTTANVGSDNLLDSDAPASGDVPVLATDIPLVGANNHSFDVGYAATTPPSCSINTPTVSTICNNNGTASDPSDDTFTYTINAGGTGVGSTYSISGGDTQTGLTYNANHVSTSSFPISGGNLTLTLTDDTTASCTLGNVTVTAPATCSGSTPTVDLELTKVADKTNVSSGDAVRFTITVMNKGPDMATNVEVTDLLPADVTYQSYTASQGTYTPLTGIWAVGSLTSGTSETLMLDVIGN